LRGDPPLMSGFAENARGRVAERHGLVPDDVVPDCASSPACSSSSTTGAAPIAQRRRDLCRNAALALNSRPWSLSEESLRDWCHGEPPIPRRRAIPVSWPPFTVACSSHRPPPAVCAPFEFAILPSRSSIGSIWIWSSGGPVGCRASHGSAVLALRHRVGVASGEEVVCTVRLLMNGVD
jgi:hypothetical protein